MAMNTVIRGASRSFLPRALRAVVTPRIFHRAISAAVDAEKGSLVPGFSRVLSLKFSTLVKPSLDEGLVRVIDSEIKCVPEPDAIETMPEGFPFKVQDLAGENTILLERVYRDETIKVRVEVPAKLDDDEDVEENNDEDDINPVFLPMVVTISKGSGFYMEIGVTAFPGEITIDNLSLKYPDAPEDRLLYEGPDSSDLDENMHKALQKYLEVRGINTEVTKLLLDYMIGKDNREYAAWLKNFKSFVLK